MKASQKKKSKFYVDIRSLNNDVPMLNQKKSLNYTNYIGQMAESKENYHV